jgi:DNA primase
VIPDSFKQDLLNRVDIVDVISGRVQLRKSGANWVGLCPFHGEKTPSFTVSQTKQFYHCFGCGVHGNAIGFLMEYGGLGYVEALKELAEGVGLKLPEYSGGERKARPAEEGPDLYELLAQAARHFRESLKGSQRAIDYLKGRGLTGKTAARFGIGYAPTGWQSLAAVFPRYEDKALVECGLVIENEGKRYDRFRDRVMFPILNQRGIVIGFGGRVLEGDDGPATGEGKGTPGPKYLNSPETPVFEKGRELYGLPQARDAIRGSARVIVVEGYMDVVMLAEHGVENAVATLGTATTPVHVQKLLRQAEEVVFCFDGDAAGRRAAWHALEVSLEALSDRKTVRFLFLPPEHDPDSFVRAHGREAFEREVKQSQPLSAFLLGTLTARVDLSTLEGRSRLIADAKPLVKRIAAPTLRVQLVKALAESASMAPVEAAKLLEVRDGAITNWGRSAPPRADRTALAIDGRVERELTACLLAAPELATDLDFACLDTTRPDASTVAELATFLQRQPEVRNVAGVLEAFRDTEHERNLAAAERVLLEMQLDRDTAAAVFRDAQANLLNRLRKARHSALAERVRAGTATDAERTEYVQLSGARTALNSRPEPSPNSL